MDEVTRDGGRVRGSEVHDKARPAVGLAVRPVPAVPPEETPPAEGCLSGALGEQDSPDTPAPGNRIPMIIALVWVAVITIMMVGMVVGLAVGVITG